MMLKCCLQGYDVADEAKIFSVLRSAKTVGLIRPEMKEVLFLHPTVNKANKILYLLHIKGDKSATTEQISEEMGLNYNTTGIILRALMTLGFCDKTLHISRKGRGMVAVWTLNSLI